MLADHAATAIANSGFFTEIERLREQLQVWWRALVDQARCFLLNSSGSSSLVPLNSKEIRRGLVGLPKEELGRWSITHRLSSDLLLALLSNPITVTRETSYYDRDDENISVHAQEKADTASLCRDSQRTRNSVLSFPY